MALFHDPICLIHGGKDGLKVTEEGIRFLETLQEPIAVVCLAGQYRTGKSFFLNQLTRTKSQETKGRKGFQVGPTTESCTRGIWLWDPSPSIRNSRGEKIIFMDTEGMASTDNDESYDAKIFSLGILLSSLFIFNTMGVIDETAIDRLYLVAELTKHICIHTNPTNLTNLMNTKKKQEEQEEEKEEKHSSDVLAQHFPPFIWLLRDFILEIEQNSNGKQLNANEYLEKALEPREKNHASNNSTISQRRNEERNQIRKSIRTLFTKRQCFTLVRPVLDEKDLRKAFELKEEELRPEFIIEMEKIRQQILTNINPKILYGQQMNGPQMAHLVHCYINTMNTGQIPDIKAAWEYVSDATNQNALTQAMQKYDELLKKVIFPSSLKNLVPEVIDHVDRVDLADDADDVDFVEDADRVDLPNADLVDANGVDLVDLKDDIIILDPPQFEKIHKQAQEEALNLFKRISIEGPTRIPCLTKLKQFFTEEKIKYINLLQKRSTIFCEKLLEKLYQQHFKSFFVKENESEWEKKWFSSSLTEEEMDFFQIQQKLKEMESIYDTKAQGPSKNKVFFHFLRSTICMDLFQKCFFFARQVSLRHQEEWTNEMQNLQQTYQSNETKWNQDKESLLHQIELLKTKKKHVDEKNQVLQDQLTKKTEEKDELTKEFIQMTNEKKLMEQNVFESKNQYQQIVHEKNQLIQEKELTKQKMSGQIDFLQEELSLQKQKRDFLQKEKEDFIEQMALQTSSLLQIQQELDLKMQECFQVTEKFNLQAQEICFLQEKIDLCQVKEQKQKKDLIALKEQLSVQQNQFTKLLFEQEQNKKQNQLLTERVDRLTKHLVDVNTKHQIESTIQDMLTRIECELTKEQELLFLQEEKNLLQEKFNEFLFKITILPVFYQRQLFLYDTTDDTTGDTINTTGTHEPDFFDVLTQ